MGIRKIIYVGYQNFPFAALAASIRVGLLPAERLPEAEQLLELPFIKEQFTLKGKLTLIGSEPGGNPVYAIWNKDGQLLNGTIRSFLKIHALPRDSCSIIQVLSPEPYLLSLGLSLGRYPLLSGLAAALSKGQLQTYYPPLSGLALAQPGQLDYAW